MPSSAPVDEVPLRRNALFQRLFWAHVVSLVGAGLSSVALALLAHELEGANASVVLGVTLAIRIGVIVLCAPWAGVAAEALGPRRLLITSDVVRAGVVLGLCFAQEVWHIYVLAVFLNLGSALFTPVYKALIPGVVSNREYPRALAWGTIAYDTANILGPVLAGVTIALVGFRGNFVLDAVTFGLSALILLGLPRGLGARDRSAAPKAGRVHNDVLRGVRAMLGRWQLREALLLALQVSVAGAFVLVATIAFVKDRLALPDSFYAWAMGAYGLGSVAAAALYSRAGARVRLGLAAAAAPGMLVALGLAAVAGRLEVLCLAWVLAGAGQSILGIRGNELLAAHSEGEERAHVFAAHFSLSHAGWGIFYPLAGGLTAWLGFSSAALCFSGLLLLVCVPQWLGQARLYLAHRGLPSRGHEHEHAPEDPPGLYHAHLHRHGDLVHSHPHRHGVPHSHERCEKII